jgi:hypothetical protein
MGNLTVSSLLENIFRAKDRVAREITGFIPSVTINSSDAGVSTGGTVTSHYAPAPTLNTSVTPAMTIPEGDNQTIAVDTVTIGQTANVQIPVTGEVWRQIDNTAGQALLDDMFTQAIRKIVNAIETHVGSVAYKGASRAVGTAGTTPFASNFNTIADIRKVLIDNGCPDDGMLSLVINTAAGAKLRQLASLYQANTAGTSETLRRGSLLDLLGIAIRESAQVASHTKGTGSGYLINLGNVAVGSTALTLDTGSGTIVAGDILTHASDSTNKYVVKTALASNVVTIANPGLLIATANNDAVTVGDSYTANVAMHKSAIELVMRPPAQPYGGDAAADRMTIRDEQTGLVFEVATYKGYQKNIIDITCVYQAKVWKPENVAILLG